MENRTFAAQKRMWRPRGRLIVWEEVGGEMSRIQVTGVGRRGGMGKVSAGGEALSRGLG